MSFIDLTHVIHSGISLFPGTPLPETSVLANHKLSGFHETKYHITSHMGTHVDAPFHILKEGKTLDTYTLDHFTGSAICIKVVGHKEISLDFFLSHEERIRNHDFLLIETGWSAHWCSDAYMQDYPVLSEDLCHWLGQQSLKGLGIDMPSVDPPSSVTLPNHHRLLGNDILIIENLTNLNQLTRATFQFFALPLRFENMDGGQVRACAKW